MEILAATAGPERVTHDSSARASRRAFFGVSALVFIASAALTIAWCAPMSRMPGMPMPGGWTMSMTWMLMPGQSWLGAAAMFVGMWVVMMVAMMLPSLAPVLWRYRLLADHFAGHDGQSNSRLARATRAKPPAQLTAIVAAGYFFAWALLGIAVYPPGVVLAAIEMQVPALSRAVPLAAGVIVMLAGALQFTSWKARRLACCRQLPQRGSSAVTNAGAAWRYGLRLGLHCSLCCSGLMAVLLVVGVMDLRAMAAVAAAITLERLAPAGVRMARAVGAVVIGVGVLLVVL